MENPFFVATYLWWHKHLYIFHHFHIVFNQNHSAIANTLEIIVTLCRPLEKGRKSQEGKIM